MGTWLVSFDGSVSGEAFHEAVWVLDEKEQWMDSKGGNLITLTIKAFSRCLHSLSLSGRTCLLSCLRVAAGVEREQATQGHRGFLTAGPPCGSKCEIVAMVGCCTCVDSSFSNPWNCAKWKSVSIEGRHFTEMTCVVPTKKAQVLIRLCSLLSSIPPSSIKTLIQKRSQQAYYCRLWRF